MSKKSITSRRDFISNTVKGGLALGLGLGTAVPLTSSAATKNIPIHLKTGFDQQPLPYAYTALEDVIDSMTMEIHFSKHAAGYAKNVKEAATAEGVDISKSLEEVLAKISTYSTKMRNNAGGHYNHEMFWQCMRPKIAENAPTGKLMDAITKQFTSFEYFKKQFAEAGKTRFGSGWAWLYVNKNKKLTIGSTANQDNPLMDVSEIKGYPLLGVDVWEHAYYLKYQNKRSEYLDNWWQVVNWDYVASRFNLI